MLSVPGLLRCIFATKQDLGAAMGGWSHFPGSPRWLWGWAGSPAVSRVMPGRGGCSTPGMVAHRLFTQVRKVTV